MYKYCSEVVDLNKSALDQFAVGQAVRTYHSDGSDGNGVIKHVTAKTIKILWSNGTVQMCKLCLVKCSCGFTSVSRTPKWLEYIEVFIES